MQTSRSNNIPLKNGGMRQINMPKKPERGEFVRHPEFMERFTKALGDTTFPADKIPGKFGIWLYDALWHVPFASLRMPMEVYKELIDKDPLLFPFGLLQKAADIIYNSKPSDHTNRLEYVVIIESMAAMINEMQIVITPFREQVIDELMAFEEENAKKRVAKASIIK